MEIYHQKYLYLLKNSHLEIKHNINNTDHQHIVKSHLLSSAVNTIITSLLCYITSSLIKVTVNPIIMSHLIPIVTSSFPQSSNIIKSLLWYITSSFLISC